MVMKKNGMMLLLFFLSAGLWAQEMRMEKVVELRGEWKFEIGDNPAWAKTDFDDSGWEKVFAPSYWEEEGFPGYDGMAWYRREFRFDKGDKEQTYYLLLGNVDDVDATYLNGRLIGAMGGFPPNFVTQYNSSRQYYIPNEYLNFSGKNVIAVRVYDDTGPGGIVNGKVGIYINRSHTIPDIELSGLWEFHTGDDPEWKDKNYDDSDWKQVFVPLNWEYQGFIDYDGIAWYRKSFTLPKSLEGQRLILLLGKIDDFDETFLNGEELGHNGRIVEKYSGKMLERDNRRRAQKEPDTEELGDYWQRLRAYYIPADMLVFGGENQIAIRVYDGYKMGGFYEGPIGVFTRERYMRWKDRESSGDDILELIFGN
jgi:sialate O-acetylesterase